ncbi:MAG: radical SAM/SPASM domain-containing protein [Promethearchaeota archaeon]|jgi:MoaA/NifB/PqqE/SkfB family radical SAM enzyme
MEYKNTKFLHRTLKKVDPNLANIFMPWILKHPRSIYTMMRLARSYKKSRKIRTEELLKGLNVPPFLILSLTSNCNLTCAGCYAAAAGISCRNNSKPSLHLEEWMRIIKEATDLGVFGFILAGGEPFLLPNLLNICEKYHDRLFIIVSNGTALRDQDFDRLKRLKNVVVMVSIEGDEESTDLRRGKGVYDQAKATIKRLDQIGILCGVSATITRFNFEYWMESKNIDNLISEGVRLAFLLEYIPVDNNTELMLKENESAEFRKVILNYRNNKQIFIIHSPGDEEFFGGCVSAGRGFAHITPLGDLTACPISDIATHNLTKSSLKDGLDCELFKIIRENEQLLETNGSPCSLFSHSNELVALIKETKAYTTKI